MLAACSSYKPIYHITVTGDADGDVSVTFPDGKFFVNGTTDLEFAYGNDTTVVVTKKIPLTLEQGFASANKDINEVAFYARQITEGINATTAGGTYYLVIDALFKEPVTETEIHTHKILTNRVSE